VVHLAIRILGRKHAVPTRHVLNHRRGAGKESPAGEIGTERLCIFSQHVNDPNRSWFEGSRGIARIALIHLNAALRSGAVTFDR